MLTASGAAAKVFAIPELLEPILLYAALPDPLPTDQTAIEQSYGITSPPGTQLAPSELPSDLIKCIARSRGLRFILTSALRVNKLWNAVITDSRAIQETLFFRWGGTVYSSSRPTFNPLLASTFTWGYFFNLPLSAERDAKIRESIVYEKASWRTMFPVVPPVREFRVTCENLTDYWDYYSIGEIPLPTVGQKDGLRMGLLFDVFEEFGGGYNQSVTWSRATGYAPDLAQIWAGPPKGSFLDATSVGSVQLWDKTASERRGRTENVRMHPKLVSKGKQWGHKCINWTENIRTK